MGHRGALIGSVERLQVRDGQTWIIFQTARALERHDGLQVDLPVLGKPFGFAVERLRVIAQGHRGGAAAKETFEAGQGDTVEVLLPEDYPNIPVGAPIYCSSSQAVKRAYRFDRPKPGLFRPRQTVDIEIDASPSALTAVGRMAPIDNQSTVEARVEVPEPFETTRDPQQIEQAALGLQQAGDTGLSLGQFHWRSQGCFRADLAAECSAVPSAPLWSRHWKKGRVERVQRIEADVCRLPAPASG